MVLKLNCQSFYFFNDNINKAIQPSQNCLKIYVLLIFHTYILIKLKLFTSKFLSILNDLRQLSNILKFLVKS